MTYCNYGAIKDIYYEREVKRMRKLIISSVLAGLGISFATYYLSKREKYTENIVRIPYSAKDVISKENLNNEIVRFSYDEETISKLIHHVDTIEHLGVDIKINPKEVHGSFFQIIFPLEISKEHNISASLLAEYTDSEIVHLKKFRLNKDMSLEDRTYTFKDLEDFCIHEKNGDFPNKLIVKLYAMDSNESYINISDELHYDRPFIIDFIGNDKTKLIATFWGIVGITGQSSQEFNVQIDV